MHNYKYVYGPVPSRRLGMSLGISPIPRKTCNYSCIYCQLGRTDKLKNKREIFFDAADIITELKKYLNENIQFDVITIVGEGEPTLFLKLGELIDKVKELTEKPVVVITNGSLLMNLDVRNDLKKADIILPSLDAYDDNSFKEINRPHGSLKFNDVLNGLKFFSYEFDGQIWIETMIIKDINDDVESLTKLKTILDTIKYDKLYINTPIRPPAEEYAKEVSEESLNNAVKILNGISIEQLISVGFHSEILDDYEAINSIIKRHPMNQYEIEHFLITRKCLNIDEIYNKLKRDSKIKIIEYKGYITYRI